MSKIKKARQEAGLTQAKMSKLMGIPKRTIENWDSGKVSPSAYVERLIIKELKGLKNKK